MADVKKQAVSLRLGPGDIRRIKALADRLGANESDVVRFAIRMLMTRMLPLCDPSVTGRHLLPVFAELGSDAVRHFELDADRLEEIINEGAKPGERVDLEDITLLTMLGTHESYARLSLRAIANHSKPPASGERRDESPAGQLRRYLYSKYGLITTDNEKPATAIKSADRLS